MVDLTCMVDPAKIRNFCIIAHIDHGKSTLADRFLEITNTLTKREMKRGQMLDSMDLEQERGITIKLAPVRMEWNYKGEDYILNLIDTPGHVDFSYEVSRSLACCEGAILIVDATQGIQAQTLAHTYVAMEHNLEIIAVINKIDLPAADPDRVTHELVHVLGVKEEDIIRISAKEGTNVEKILERVVEKVPPASEKNTGEMKALVFDSLFDTYKGVVTYVRVFEGSIQKGQKVYFLHTKKEIEVLEVGFFKPKYHPSDILECGEIGYVVTGVRGVRDARVGDTLWSSDTVPLVNAKPLHGYKKVMPYVFASIFCIEGEDYPMLRDALDKLVLNDSALSFEPEQSTALGHGFRCGFLGLLHLEIVVERLEREYGLNLITTAPSVSYQVNKTDGTIVICSNPAMLPDPSYMESLSEPWMEVEVIAPKSYVGNVMTICQDRRGISKNMEYLDQDRVLITFDMPLARMVVDFYDALKSCTQGYASVSYKFSGYREQDLVKLDIMIAGNKVDAFSLVVHTSEARTVGVMLTERLKELIPRHQFEIAIQAAIGAKIIARETIGALRKDVTAKLYGGDRTRKDKLLKKQKKGKKKMKMIGQVELPREAFLAVLRK